MKPKKFLKAGVLLVTSLMLACSSIFLTACQKSTDKGEVLPHKHVWDEGEVTTSATCTEDGVLTQHCTVAGCTETNLKKIYAAHKWADPVVVDSTCTKGGSKTIECSACHEKEVETYFRIPHNIVDGVCTVCGNGPSVSLGTDEIAFITDAEDGFADLKNITENFEFPGTVYKVYAKADETDAKEMQLKTDANTTVEDRTFTRSVYFPGKANFEGAYALSRILEATYSHSGAVTVYLRANSAKQMNVWMKDGDSYKVIKEYPFVEGDKVAHVWEFEVNAGTYYFGTTTGSASIYAIDFEEKEIEVHVHDFQFDSYKTEPTCYEGGVAIYACSDATCEETEERPVARAHKYDPESTVCSVCGVDTVHSLAISELASSYTSDAEIDSVFSIMATDSKDVVVESKTASVGGNSYTHAISLKGRLNSADMALDSANPETPDAAYGRAIKIDMPSEGVIEVVANKNKGSELQIVTATAVVAKFALTASASVWTIHIEEAGTYYIGTTSSSAYIYAVTAEYIAPAHVHSFDTLKSTTTAATCHSDGEGVYECSCGETETKTIKGGHILDDNDLCSRCNKYVKSADLSSLPAAISADTTIDSVFALIAGKGLEYKNSRLKLGGKVDTANNFGRSIKITMPAGGTVFVEIQKDSATECVAYGSDKAEVSKQTLPAGKTTVEITVSAAGEYYIGTTSGSAYVYSVTVEYNAPAQTTEA